MVDFYLYLLSLKTQSVLIGAIGAFVISTAIYFLFLKRRKKKARMFIGLRQELRECNKTLIDVNKSLIKAHANLKQLDEILEEVDNA